MSSWYVHPITLNSKRDRHAVCAVDNYRALISGGNNGTHGLNTMELIDIRQTKNNDFVSSSSSIDFDGYSECGGPGTGTGTGTGTGSGSNSNVDNGRSNRIKYKYKNSNASHCPPPPVVRPNTSSSHPYTNNNTSSSTTLLPILPEARALTGHESVTHGDYLYIIGGYNTSTVDDFVPLKSVYRLNIGNIINNDDINSHHDYHGNNIMPQPSVAVAWERMEQMNEARQDFSSTCHGKYIYVFGGYNFESKSYLSTAERYNTSTNKWERIRSSTNNAVARASHASIAVGDKIYILGGRIGTNALSTTEIFDTVTQTYSRGPDLFCPLHSFSAVAIEDWIVTIGGRSDDPSKALNQSFVWNTAAEEDKGSGGERKGKHKSKHKGKRKGERKGEHKGNDEDDENGTWHQTQQHLILPRKDHAAVVLNDTEIVVLGGSSGNGGFTFDSIESISFQDMDINDSTSSNGDDGGDNRGRSGETHHYTSNSSQPDENISLSNGYNETWQPTTPVATPTPQSEPIQPSSSVSVRPSVRPSTQQQSGTVSVTSSPTIIPKSPTPYEFDVFLSHNWGKDDIGRDNHQRVNLIKQELNARGIKTWFDSEQLSGQILDEMTAGIDRSMAVIVFVTNAYITKVSGEGPKGDKDNCKMEFSYAWNRKTPEKIIPVVMEETCCEATNWKGVVGGTLGNCMHFRFTSEDQLGSCVDSLVEKIQNIRDSLDVSYK